MVTDRHSDSKVCIHAYGRGIYFAVAVTVIASDLWTVSLFTRSRVEKNFIASRYLLAPVSRELYLDAAE